MSNTFVHRRHDVVSLQLSLKEIKERWPALFDVSQNADSTFNVEEELAAQVMTVYLVRKESGQVDGVGIVIEGSTVLNHLGDLSRACCYLLGLTYALDLKYPKTLKYMFEVFQKMFVEVDSRNLSAKVQRLRNNVVL
ncbi:hypothetical protein DPEC_G00332350 [Dallia pectoralis]|uniref:Uncharacterized protein n=1 Tax=Dallia pectoralis TaxID=75939 RepID=A0ACC2F652_DALPE|nr:hypothetical protein DPEC_G00332350 [Dallia pectoralis]